MKWGILIITGLIVLLFGLVKAKGVPFQIYGLAGVVCIAFCYMIWLIGCLDPIVYKIGDIRILVLTYPHKVRLRIGLAWRGTIHFYIWLGWLGIDIFGRSKWNSTKFSNRKTRA